MVTTALFGNVMYIVALNSDSSHVTFMVSVVGVHGVGEQGTQSTLHT